MRDGSQVSAAAPGWVCISLARDSKASPVFISFLYSFGSDDQYSSEHLDFDVPMDI